jgi:type II restriction/modification system DNA methylase subunit YeeA
MPLEEASLYEVPFEYVKSVVYPEQKNRSKKRQQDFWWLHARPSLQYRHILATLERYIVSPTVSKHQVFVWLDRSTLVDHACFVFAHDDDYFFGVLHSRAHELWPLRMCTWLGKGNEPRYTPTTCFEIFPLP